MTYIHIMNVAQKLMKGMKYNALYSKNYQKNLLILQVFRPFNKSH